MATRQSAPPKKTDAPSFSILVTCFCEDSVIEEFHARLSTALQKISLSYEIVYVDDGSTDATFRKLTQLYESDLNIGCLVGLLGNVGQTNAQTAAIAHATGKDFIFIDADLQVDPEDIVPLVELFSDGYDLVSGYRKRRCDPYWRRIASSVANMLLSRVSRHQLRDIGCGMKILHGELIRSFQFSQYKPFRPVSVVRAAQKCVDSPINHHPRRVHKSGWTIYQLVAFYRNIFVETVEHFFHILVLVCCLLTLCLVGTMALMWESGWLLPVPTALHLLIAVTGISTLLNTVLLGLLGEFAMRNTRMFQEDPVYIVRTLLSRQ